MKEQRWPGDYQTISQEFRSSRAEEDIGLGQQNTDLGNDYMTSPGTQYDAYQKEEFEPSWTMKLDTVGMQPHAREYLERRMDCMRSHRKYEEIEGQPIHYTPGIQFSGRP